MWQDYQYSMGNWPLIFSAWLAKFPKLSQVLVFFFFPDLFAVLRQERFKRTSHLFSCSPARNTTWAITIHGRVKVLTVLQTPRPDRKHGKAYSPLLSVLSLCAARYCWYTGTYSYIRMPIKTELGITAMEGMVSKLKMETNVGLKRRSVCRYYPDFWKKKPAKSRNFLRSAKEPRLLSLLLVT